MDNYILLDFIPEKIQNFFHKKDKFDGKIFLKVYTLRKICM